MPNVVLEAMAAGRPVIASKVEGIAELVQDGVTGITFVSEQSVELAAAIRTLIADDEFINAAGVASQGLVRKCFTPAIVNEMYVETYRKILIQNQ